MIKTLLKKKYLRRITGVKQEKFEKCVSRLKRAWGAAQRRKRVIGRPYGIGDLREHLLLLMMYYRTYTTHLFLAQIFKVDEATICRAIKRIAPLAERILKIKPERLLSENDLQLLIVDATEQRIERPKISAIITLARHMRVQSKRKLSSPQMAGFYVYLSPMKDASTTSKSVKPKARFRPFRFWQIPAIKASKTNT